MSGVLRPVDMLPPGYTKMLGDLVIRWAIVEHTTLNCIHTLMRTSRRIASIAAREPRVSDRIGIIRELAEVNKITLSTDTKQLAKDAFEAEEHRNKLVHSVWCVQEGTGDVFIIRTAGSWPAPGIGKRVSRRMVPEAIPWTLADFREPHLAISAVLNRLAPLYREIVDARGPWPGRLP